MIPGQDFLYFLHSADYKFYYTDQWGVFNESANPTPIDYSPQGWDAISIQWQRNSTNWGMDRTFTVPLDFVEDGAAIIKNIVYKFGTEGKLFMTVMKQHIEVDLVARQYGFIYKPLYKGEPDFSTYSHEGAKVTVNFIEGGLAKLINANKDTVYEFDVDEIEVQHTPIALKETASFLLLEQEVISSSGDDFFISMGAVNTTTEGTAVGIVTGNSIWKNLAGFDLATNDDRFILESYDQTTVLNFSGDMSFDVLDSGDVRIYFQKDNGTIYDILPLTTYSSAQHVTLNFNTNVDVAPGEKVFIFLYLHSLAVKFPETTFKAQYFTRFKTTLVKYIRSITLLQRIIAKITDNKYQVESLLLRDNPGFVLTCGDALRGLPGAKIKTSLSDFCKWADAEFCAGYGVVGNQFRLEHREFWITGDTIDLGEVSGLKVSPASDLLFNTIKVGYSNQTYDDVNGKDEFNNTSQYTTPRTIAKVYEQISPYRFDMFGMEFTRMNLTGKTTTDSSSDNDTFGAVAIPSANIWPLDRMLNAGTTGLIDPASAFNLPASPRHMLERHGWYIHSVMDKLDAGYLKFQTTDKNSNVVINGDAENADINIGTLADKKFLPWVFEFTTETPDDYELLLEGTALKKYKFTYQGIPGLGIAMKSGVSPADNKTQVFQLLADATVDMSKFIDIYE